MIQTLAALKKSKTLQETLQIIKESNRITFLTHMRPDADGISACAALSLWCQSMGKKVETIYPSESGDSIYAHPNNVLINEHNQKPDLLIACDTANYERLYYPESFKQIPLINIDHHVSNSINGIQNLVVPELSSTCELVYRLLEIWSPASIDETIASILLFGILYDTQSFQTSHTNKQTLITATELMEKGADLFALNRRLYAHKTTAMLNAWGELLQNMQQSKTGQSVWLTLDQETYHKGTADTIHNFIIQNMNVDIVALFAEVDAHTTKISLRSTKTDVNALAQKFGGGGHKNAAGALIKKSLEETVTAVTKYFA